MACSDSLTAEYTHLIFTVKPLGVTFLDAFSTGHTHLTSFCSLYRFPLHADTVSSTVFLRSIATAQTVVSLETPVEFTMCSVHMRYVGQSTIAPCW